MSGHNIMHQILARKWIAYAKADLDAAEVLLRSRSKKVSPWTQVLVLWHCHQAAEKMLKMALVSKGKELLLTHDLPTLLARAGIKGMPEHLVKLLFDLNPHYIRSRYPDIAYRQPYPRVSRVAARDYLARVSELFVWLKQYVIRKKR